MRKILLITLCILSTVAMLGITVPAFATQATDTNILAPVTTDVISNPYNMATDTDNGLANANETGKNVNLNNGSNVSDIVKSTGMTMKFGPDGVREIPGAQVVTLPVSVTGNTTAGFATVTVTAAGMQNSPRALSVPVGNNDTAEQVAANIVTALKNDPYVSDFFNISLSNNSTEVILMTKVKAASDAAMNMSIVNSTSTSITEITQAIISYIGGNSNISTSTQRTHGEYQNNTNSCASCHQTHTGASDNLLFKNGVYNTCTACHDGTLGFYNVFQLSTAGTFGGTVAGNASFHMANGTLETKAAPGGNRSATFYDGTTPMKNWTGEFTCASCHSPHGSYSSRLLNFNPNGIASVPMFDTDGSYTGTTGATTGGQMVRETVVNALPTADANSPAYVVVQTQADTVLDASIINNTNMDVASSDTVVVVMKKTGDGLAGTPYAYVRDTNPWIFGGEYKVDHSYKINFTKFYPAAALADLNVEKETALGLGYDPQITKGITFNYQQGFVKLSASMTDGKNPANTYATLVGQQADISRAFVVKMTMDNNDYTWFGTVKITKVNPISYVSGSSNISTFCSACHTDYLSRSGSNVTGVWTKAYRHITTDFSCLKCHFSHGTDVTAMLDAQDRNISQVAIDLFGGPSEEATSQATAYMLDKNPTSVLKRYTNNSICLKCHTEIPSNQ